MSHGQLRAEADLKAIRDAIYVLGRPATVQEIVELSGLPADRVKKRLNASGPSCVRPEWRQFTHDKLTNLWGLTLGAKQEAEKDAKK